MRIVQVEKKQGIAPAKYWKYDDQHIERGFIFEFAPEIGIEERSRLMPEKRTQAFIIWHAHNVNN
jgi:hypothetical protein